MEDFILKYKNAVKFKPMNRVVITGMGIYSTIGKNIEEVK